MTFLYENEDREHTLIHIPCIMGGLGNALTYALVTGKCDSVGGYWGVAAIGRDERDGDMIMTAALTPSERRDVLDRCTRTTD